MMTNVKVFSQHGHQRRSESLREFGDRIVEAAAEADITDRTSVYFFLLGAYVQTQVSCQRSASRPPRTVDKCINYLRRRDVDVESTPDEAGLTRSRNDPPASPKPVQASTPASSSPRTGSNPWADSLANMAMEHRRDTQQMEARLLQSIPGVVASMPRNPAVGPLKIRMDPDIPVAGQDRVICGRCHLFGHPREKCFLLSYKQLPKMPSECSLPPPQRKYSNRQGNPDRSSPANLGGQSGQNSTGAVSREDSVRRDKIPAEGSGPDLVKPPDPDKKLSSNLISQPLSRTSPLSPGNDPARKTAETRTDLCTENQTIPNLVREPSVQVSGPSVLPPTRIIEPIKPRREKAPAPRSGSSMTNPGPIDPYHDPEQENPVDDAPLESDDISIPPDLPPLEPIPEIDTDDETDEGPDLESTPHSPTPHQDKIRVPTKTFYEKTLRRSCRLNGIWLNVTPKGKSAHAG
ncbi:hypothetical protein AC1031_008083 [Aphanomyces cochlioides]|nr:hypothetical protein AC1031_008083 [Aphanomyces cochlioides]